MNWYWVNSARGILVNMVMQESIWFRWDKIRGVRVGRWFIGAIKGDQII